MYLFRLNSLYRASPAGPELPPDMPGIALKMRENRIRAALLGLSATGAGNPEGT
jgi:hypothetical protein